MLIREAADTELEAILAVERAAFGCEEGAGLLRDLLDDPRAGPCFSLLAFQDDRAVGHILFTRAAIGAHRN